MNGHGDVIGGVSTCKNKEDLDQMKMFRKDFCFLMAPMDAFLCGRGLKTLPIRIDILIENDIKVAKFCEKHPKIKKVNHPWLETFLGHEFVLSKWKDVVKHFLLKWTLLNLLKKYIEWLKVYSLVVSLGTLDTLIEHPASMTSIAIPKELMRKQGISPELVRISAGIENIEDIIADLKQALDKCYI